MSFVAGFFSFSLEIMNSDRDAFHKVRLKTPLHPYESRQHLYARMLALIHAYEEGLAFSQGLYAPEEPTIWKKDSVGLIQTWIDIGAPEVQKIKRALRLYDPPRQTIEYRIYFYAADQISSFCHHLRGSKSNWVSPITFFEIPEEILVSLIALEQTSSCWSVTIVDNTMYLIVNGQELSTAIRTIPIWEQFQLSIRNTA